MKRKTAKEILADSFQELAAVKSVDKITIQEIVDNTELFKGQVDMDENGRILAGEDCRTNLPGVFAAGDVRVKEIRQLTTAAADGTTAALLAEQYLSKL